MARTEQPAITDATKAQIGLLMRTGPFTGNDALAIAKKQQLDGLHPHAQNTLVAKRFQQ